ncbi:MAG TPA: hypothetical protein VIX59_20625 [Candidatus Binataceae bacterium]
MRGTSRWSVEKVAGPGFAKRDPQFQDLPRLERGEMTATVQLAPQIN